MTRRSYAGGAVATTITSDINAAATSFSLAADTGWPDGTGGPFIAVIDRGVASKEERVLVATRSGTTLTSVTRGYDGTTATTHSAGAAIEVTGGAIDFDEANALVNLASAKGDVLAASAADTWAIVPAGTDGYVFVTDSAASTGTKWADPSTLAGSNLDNIADVTISGVAAGHGLVYSGSAWVNGGVGLIAYKSHNPVSDTTYSISSQPTFADIDATNLVVTFTVPITGRVLVRLTAAAFIGGDSNHRQYWNLRQGSSDVAGTTVRVASYLDLTRVSLPLILTGLTPGTSVTYKWGWACSVGGTAGLYTGDGSQHYGPAVMEVWAA